MLKSSYHSHQKQWCHWFTGSTHLHPRAHGDVVFLMICWALSSIVLLYHVRIEISCRTWSLQPPLSSKWAFHPHTDSFVPLLRLAQPPAHVLSWNLCFPNPTEADWAGLHHPSLLATVGQARNGHLNQQDQLHSLPTIWIINWLQFIIAGHIGSFSAMCTEKQDDGMCRESKG